MDGFYVAYLTGRTGNSLVLFAVKNGRIIGVDPGGLRYDGQVTPLESGGFSFVVEYIVKPGVGMITGGGAGVDTPVKLNFNKPANFQEGAVVRVDTPFGPVNAKISKVRDFDI